MGEPATLEMARRPCPACGSEDDTNVFAESTFDASRLDAFAFASRKVPEYMHHRMVACPSCDLLYSSPAPTPASLERAYERAAFDATGESRLASLDYARLLARIQLPDREGALDIGAGDGAFLEQLLADGFSGVVGVEPSRAPVALAEPSVRPLIRQSPFRAHEFTPESFRLVTCFQTMEHVPDPLGLCRAAYALLKERGAILLVCHNRRALTAKVLGLRSPIFDIEHLQLFSPTSLAFTLSRAGFSAIEVRPLTNRYPLDYWTRLLPAPSGLKGRALAVLRATGLGKVRVGLRAGNIAAIAYKL